MARRRTGSDFYQYLMGPYTLGLNAQRPIKPFEFPQLHDCTRDSSGNFTARTKGWGLDLAPRFLRALDGIEPGDVKEAIEVLRGSRTMRGPVLVAALEWYLFSHAARPDYDDRTLERQRDEAAAMVETIFFQHQGRKVMG